MKKDTLFGFYPNDGSTSDRKNEISLIDSLKASSALVRIKKSFRKIACLDLAASASLCAIIQQRRNNDQVLRI